MNRNEKTSKSLSEGSRLVFRLTLLLLNLVAEMMMMNSDQIDLSSVQSRLHTRPPTCPLSSAWCLAWLSLLVTR